MITFRHDWARGVAVALALVLTGQPWASAADVDKANKPAANNAEQPAKSADKAAREEYVPKLERSSQLLGMPVQNPQKQELGKIEDLVLDSGRDRLAYAVLSFGGILGVGDKYFAIPWSALEYNHVGHVFILNATKAELEKAPGFDKKNWPDFANPQWNRQIQEYYKQPAERNGSAGRDLDPKAGDRASRAAEPNTPAARDAAANADAGTAKMRRVSQLKGMAVKSPAEKKLGDIKEIIVDMHLGRPAYAIITDGGVVGINERLTAVPWSALKVQADNSIALDADRPALDALAFKEAKYPDFADQAYARMLHERFNQQPYWLVVGYGVVIEPLDASWRSDSPYNRMVLNKEPKTIEGAVESVGAFAPAEGEANGVQIVVQTKDNQRHTVHVGPRDFVSSQGVTFKKDQDVKVTGCEVTYKGQKVLIARQITVGGKSLELRDREGRPLWDRAQENADRPSAGENRDQPKTAKPQR